MEIVSSNFASFSTSSVPNSLQKPKSMQERLEKKVGNVSQLRFSLLAGVAIAILSYACLSWKKTGTSSVQRGLCSLAIAATAVAFKVLISGKTSETPELEDSMEQEEVDEKLKLELQKLPKDLEKLANDIRIEFLNATNDFQRRSSGEWEQHLQTTQVGKYYCDLTAQVPYLYKKESNEILFEDNRKKCIQLKCKAQQLLAMSSEISEHAEVTKFIKDMDIPHKAAKFLYLIGEDGFHVLCRHPMLYKEVIDFAEIVLSSQQFRAIKQQAIEATSQKKK